MSELSTLSVEGRIARLTLRRAEKRNALSLDLLASLRGHVRDLAERSDVSVCVITGDGATFCAGMDLKAVLREPGAPLKLLTAIAELTIELRALPQVTVARVNGAAIGGGCGLVAVCDIAITHPEAKLGYPEVGMGVCPAVVAPWLVQAVGAGRARRILLQGGTMNGVRALEEGLVSGCVTLAELDGAVEECAARMASAGPAALRATKALLNEIDGARLNDLARRGAQLSASVIAGDEAQRMLAKAFGGG